MQTAAALAVVAGWLVLAAAISWSIVRALRAALAEDAAPLLFARLERRGIAPAELADRVGTDALARAVRRCVLCSGKAACRARQPVDCPNRAMLEHAT